MTRCTAKPEPTPSRSPFVPTTSSVRNRPVPPHVHRRGLAVLVLEDALLVVVRTLPIRVLLFALRATLGVLTAILQLPCFELGIFGGR